MKTEEHLYGKITASLPNEYKHTLAYYILDSDIKIAGTTVHVYGLKAEETKNNNKSKNKCIIDITSSHEEIETLAEKMLTEFATLNFFENIIEDYIA